MKSFFMITFEMKKICCLFFSGEVVVYAMIAYFLGLDNISLALIWQMVFISLILTLLQYGLYTTNCMKKVKNWIKVLVHYTLLLVFGILFAKLFNWFDLSDVKLLSIAILIGTTCFLSISGSIYIYTKLTGEKFNEKLKIYKDLKKESEVK